MHILWIKIHQLGSTELPYECWLNKNATYLIMKDYCGIQPKSDPKVLIATDRQIIINYQENDIGFKCTMVGNERLKIRINI